jgi:hypothetical protein
MRRGVLFIKRNKIPVVIASSALLLLSCSGLLFLRNLKQKEQEAAHERERSLQLSSEIDHLTAEYEMVMSHVGGTRRELAKKLIRAARARKSSSVFTQPVVPFREVNRLIDQALELAPDLAEAQFQYFSNHCIMLNFKEALQYSIGAEHQKAGYLRYVEAFSEFDYTETRRPAVDELTHVFEQAKAISTDHPHLMEAILAYDFEARKDRRNYAQVVASALAYLNPELDGEFFEYSETFDQLTLNINKGELLRGTIAKSNRSFFRFLQVETLILQGSGKFNFNNLNGASIRRLDLSNLKRPVLTKRIVINGLQEVIISEHQSSSKWLRYLPTSDGLSGPIVTILN